MSSAHAQKRDSIPQAKPPTIHRLRKEILKGHSPFTIGRSPRACLLIHGIAGSPAQMHVLAQCLANSGFTARGVLLPGHGSHPDDLHGIVWQDWYEAIHEEFRNLKRTHTVVNVIGFSIGAALAAHYAAHNPVDRLVLLSIPLCPLDDRYPTDLMLRIYGTFFKQVWGKPEITVTAGGEPFCFVYERVPTAILQTMTELIKIVRHRLQQIHVPTLIIQSQNDRVSGPKSGPLAYRRISSSEKRLVMLKKSGHNMIINGERQLVFDEITRFLCRNSIPGSTTEVDDQT